MTTPLAAIDGKYEIVAKLKEGGMGAIYKVRHRLLDEVQVVKVLRPQFEDDVELRERFAREARSAIRLRHPNVVQIFDFSLEETGAGSIVMEFIEGTDLNQLIQLGQQPSIAVVLEIARQSLRALGYLHQHGFVHRDVSPDNLMLTLDVDRRPLVKLIDLGIAKRRDSPDQITVSGSFLGKFRYASPEHFGSRGPDGVEARSDLYTFGLVLYELLTGRYPIPGAGTSQLIAAHLFQPPFDFQQTDPQGKVPEEVRAMVLRSLAKTPEERQDDALAWIADIERLQQQWPLDFAAVEEARGLIEQAMEGRHPTRPIVKPGSTQRELDRQFAAGDNPPTVADALLIEGMPAAEYGAGHDAEEATHISGVTGTGIQDHALSQQAATQLLQHLRELIGEAERLIDQGEDAAAMTVLRRAQQAALPLIRQRPEIQNELSTALVRLHRKVRNRPATTSMTPPPLPEPQITASGRILPPESFEGASPDEPELPAGAGVLMTMAEIEKLREEGRLVAAWALLKKALARFGDQHSGLLEIRNELAEELLDGADD